MLPKLFDHVFIIRFLTIDLVKGEYDRFFQFACSAENVLSADLHTIFRVDHDDTCVTHSESGVRVPYEIVRLRGSQSR